MKTIPTGQKMIRLNNIMGGLTPEYIFCGFIETAALNGDFNLSTSFDWTQITEITLSLNGMPVQGFPMSMDSSRNLKLYSSFLDTVSRSKKTLAGETIDSNLFDLYYCLISHRFEGEQSNEGWLGIDIRLDEPLTKDYTFGMHCFCLNFVTLYILVMFAIRNNAITIDRYHKLTKAYT